MKRIFNNKLCSKPLTLVIVGIFLGSCGAPNPSSEIQTIVGKLGSPTSIDYAQPTHLFVVGYAGGMGNQFFASSVAKARRLQELYPSHQIVFIRSNEGSPGKFTKEVSSLGVKVLEDNSSSLTGKALLSQLLKFQKIRSLDFYSHNGAQAGVGLEPGFGDPRLGPTTPGIQTLKGHFTADAYATIHGCNGALFVAPAFSKLWQIPVSGAGSSTDFEQLHTNGNWYHNNPGQFPEGGWAKTNSKSYVKALDCKSGTCIRMKPDNAPYSKNWAPGESGGLSFYKFFCAPGVKNCEKIMAQSLLTFPSSVALSLKPTQNEFKKVLLDFLCPNNLSGSAKKSCMDSITQKANSGLEIYSPLKGNPLECSFSKCEFQADCTWDSQGFPIPQTCTLKAPKNANPKTWIREYKAYLAGFDQLP